MATSNRGHSSFGDIGTAGRVRESNAGHGATWAPPGPYAGHQLVGPPLREVWPLSMLFITPAYICEAPPVCACA
jgi:hypothetical protein